jgi:uncharacterized protein (TIGR00661 family)
VLNQIPNKKFIVYGFNKEEVHQNVSLRKFNEKEFITNLASAKGVLTNGGFTLITEAVYLGKPILTVPVVDHFEQYVNSAYIQKLNYGLHQTSFTKDGIELFLSHLDFFKSNLKTYVQNKNVDTLATVDKIIHSFFEVENSIQS